MQRNAQVRELPELRVLLEQPDRSAPKSLQPAAGAPADKPTVKSLAKSPGPTDDFDFGQPFSEPEEVVDARRNVDFDLNEALTGPPPGPEQGSDHTDAAVASGMAGPAPDDTSETSGEETIERPYTGVTLEEDMFSKTAPMPPSQLTFDFTSPGESVQPGVEEKGTAALPENNPSSLLLLPPMPGEAGGTSAPKLDLAKSNSEGPLLVPPLPATDPSESAAQSQSAKVEDLPTLDFSLPAPGPWAPAENSPKLQQAKTASDVPHLTPPPSDTPARQKQSGSNSTQSKMARIAAREGTGLKGFCPVMLRDHRDLADALPEYSAIYHGKTFFFASEEALNTFLNNPQPYVPANAGNDVIHLALTGEELEGALDNAVWYKGRLYLFSSVETMETFVAAPSSHAVAE